jgi:hypothetical protein
VRACVRAHRGEWFGCGGGPVPGARSCANCPAISMRVPGVSIPCRFRRRQRADVAALGTVAESAKGRGTSE